MSSTKDAHEQQQRISRAEHEELEEWSPDGLFMIHTFTALL